MDDNGRANHIEDYLAQLHTMQWFGFINLNGDDANKTYANLVIHPEIYSQETDGLVPNPHSLPTEQECIDGLAQLQTAFDNAKTKQETDKANANQKLKDLGLTDDEIKEIKGIE